VLTSVVKWSEGLSNRVYNINRSHTDQMKLVACRSVPFTTLFSYSCGSDLHRCIYGCMFCIKVKVKVNCTLVHALRFCTGRTAHRGSRDIAVLYRH